MKNKRIVNLEVNDSGRWRLVTSFDLDWLEDGDLEHCANSLLCLGNNPKLKARIIVPGDVAPLLVWSKEEAVWLEWEGVA